MLQPFRIFRLRPCESHNGRLWNRSALLGLFKRRVRANFQFFAKLNQIAGNTYRLERAFVGDLRDSLSMMMFYSRGVLCSSDQQFSIYDDKMQLKNPLKLHFPFSAVFFRVYGSPEITHIDVAFEGGKDRNLGVPWERFGEDARHLTDMFSHGNRRQNSIIYSTISHPTIDKFSPTLQANYMLWGERSIDEKSGIIKKAWYASHGPAETLGTILAKRPPFFQLCSIAFDPKITTPNMKIGNVCMDERESFCLAVSASKKAQQQPTQILQNDMALLALDVTPSLFENDPSGRWQFLL